LLRQADDPRLVASAEELKTRDDSQSESLLPMEAADLGERLWHVDLRDDGPVLQFNGKVFPSAVGVESYLPFVALVLPEALRQVMARIADEPAMLDDESDSWSTWGKWLDAAGVERPPADEADDEEKAAWSLSAVAVFCEKHRFASRLLASISQGRDQ
jgi:hypothetical protein